jgi:hypothetical protein
MAPSGKRYSYRFPLFGDPRLVELALLIDYAKTMKKDSYKNNAYTLLGHYNPECQEINLPFFNIIEFN